MIRIYVDLPSVDGMLISGIHHLNEMLINSILVVFKKYSDNSRVFKYIEMGLPHL